MPLSSPSSSILLAFIEMINFLVPTSIWILTLIPRANTCPPVLYTTRTLSSLADISKHHSFAPPPSHLLSSPA
ncbi:hypothetical protein EDB19DRAFT_1670490 [Suillus lakei]|nr:hypothetical protein EDB19DRAFT_1670490 [Suillus lakei]